MKRYYAYREILFGLRDEYLKLQQMLDQLSTCVTVTGKEVDSFRFNAVLGDCDEGTPSKLMLSILKKQQSILNKYKYCRQYEIANEGKENYEMNLRNGHPYLVEFDYKVEIGDQKHFDELVSQVYATKVMTIGGFDVFVNTYQTLWTCPKITLHTGLPTMFGIGWSSICYNPQSDTIDFNMTATLGRLSRTRLAEDILETGIPAFEIPEKYQELIDTNPSTRKMVDVDCSLGIGRNELQIEEQPRCFVLKKRK